MPQQNPKSDRLLGITDFLGEELSYNLMSTHPSKYALILRQSA